MTLVLRAARSTDAGKLGAMISEAVAANAWKPKLHSAAQDVAHMGDLIDRGWVTVCESGGDVAGFLALDGAQVHSLYVIGKRQNAGIGSTLIGHAKARVQRLQLWTFQANAGAQRFYQRHGFSEAERTDGTRNEEGLPDISYVWTRSLKENDDG